MSLRARSDIDHPLYCPERQGGLSLGRAPLRPIAVDSVADQHSYQQELTDLSLL